MNESPAPLTFEHAQHSLRTTGHVRLPGTMSAGAIVVIVVATLLMALDIAGAVIVGLLALLSLGFGDVLSGLVMLGILVGLVAIFPLLIWVIARASRWIKAIRQPVVMDAQGLAFRGTGPIPWSHIEPGNFTVVIASTGADTTRFRNKAQLPLSEQGIRAAELFSKTERERLGTGSGWFGDQRHPGIRIPRAKGFSERQMVELINLGRRLNVSQDRNTSR